MLRSVTERISVSQRNAKAQAFSSISREKIQYGKFWDYFLQVNIEHYNLNIAGAACPHVMQIPGT